jgi:ribosomal protein L22
MNLSLTNQRFTELTDEQLRYILKDAREAAEAMRGHSLDAEAKYLEQVCDAASVLYSRRKQC